MSRNPVELSPRALEELEVRWKKLGAPLVERLRPGLDTRTMDALTAPWNLRLSPEGRTWWGWHDGADCDSPRQPVGWFLGPLLAFWPLEVAVRQYAVRSDPTFEITDDDWPRSWFPLTAEGNGDLLLIDCSAQPSNLSPVHLWEWEHPVGTLVAGSLGELVSLWSRAIDCGAWTYVEHGDLRYWDVEKSRLDRADREHPYFR